MASSDRNHSIIAFQKKQKADSYGTAHTAVEGNTVRKVREAPVRQGNRTGNRASSADVRKNRARAQQMNLRYVVFLSAAAVVTVAICVNYLKLQASYTALQKNSTKLETQLNTLRLANDTEYNRIMSSVDLEEIKQEAIDRLGMVYSVSDQYEYYDEDRSDYVKQYSDLPEK